MEQIKINKFYNEASLFLKEIKVVRSNIGTAQIPLVVLQSIIWEFLKKTRRYMNLKLITDTVTIKRTTRLSLMSMYPYNIDLVIRSEKISQPLFEAYSWFLSLYVKMYESDIALVDVEIEGKHFHFDLKDEEQMKRMMKDILIEINKAHEIKNDAKYNEVLKQYNFLSRQFDNLKKEKSIDDLANIKKEITSCLIKLFPYGEKILSLIGVVKATTKLITYNIPKTDSYNPEEY